MSVRVLLLGDRSSGVDQGLTGWIGRHPGWGCVDRRGRPTSGWAALLEGVDAVLCTWSQPDWPDALAAYGGPLVQIGERLLPRLHTVLVDEPALGALAAEHLIETGVPHLATAGLIAREHIAIRERGFREACSPRPVLAPPYPPGEQFWSLTLPAQRRFYQDWLRSCPLPLGIFAFHAPAAFMIADAAQAIGLRLGETLALITTGLSPELAFHDPPISHIGLGDEVRAVMAMDLIGRLVAGERPPRQVLRVAPGPLLALSSSEPLMATDPAVAKALACIRAQAHRPIGVDDIATAAALSRRQLERRFRAVLGRTVVDVLWRRRLRLAERLLSATDLPLAAVAQGSGFASSSSFCHGFRLRTGITPQRFRKDRGRG